MRDTYTGPDGQEWCDGCDSDLTDCTCVCDDCGDPIDDCACYEDDFPYND